MPYGQDCNGVLIDAISGHITAVAKIDQPFPIIFGKIVHYSPHMRIGAEDSYALPYCLTCPARGIRVLGTQKVAQSLQIPDCGRGKDYLWHSGAGSSFSLPQLASQ